MKRQEYILLHARTNRLAPTNIITKRLQPVMTASNNRLHAALSFQPYPSRASRCLHAVVGDQRTHNKSYQVYACSAADGIVQPVYSPYIPVATCRWCGWTNAQLIKSSVHMQRYQWHCSKRILPVHPSSHILPLGMNAQAENQCSRTHTVLVTCGHSNRIIPGHMTSARCTWVETGFSQKITSTARGCKNAY